MKKKHIILISISLLIIILSALTTFALFTDMRSKNKITYKMGNIELEVEGSIMDDYLYPGINIIKDPFIITNKSNIDVDIRIKLDYYINEQLINIDDYTYISEDDLTLFGLTTSYDLNTTDWVLGNNQVYGDYYEFEGSFVSNKAQILSILAFDGYVVKSHLSSRDFKIALTIIAKQKDHTEWEDLGTNILN